MRNLKSCFILSLAVMITLCSRSQGYPPTWTGLNANTEANESTNVINKISGGNAYNAGGRSVEVLDSLDNGWIEYRHTAYNKEGSIRAAGFASSDPNYNSSSIDYGMTITGNSISFTNLGTILASTTLVQDDRVRITKTGSIISYSINGSGIAADTMPSQADLFLDVSIRNNSSLFHNLLISFGQPEPIDWRSLSGYSYATAQLTHSGGSSATAYAKNFLKPSRAGFVELTIDTTHKHGNSWGWGLDTAGTSFSSWTCSVKMKPNSDSLYFNYGGILTATSAISHGDKVRLEFTSDEIRLLRNSTIISEVLHTRNKPLLFMIHSLSSSGNNIYLADFVFSFPSTGRYVSSTITGIDASTAGTAAFADYGFTTGTIESIWSDSLILRDDWENAWTALDPDIKQMIDSVSYDDAVGTGITSRNFEEPGDYTIWRHQLSPDTVIKTVYHVPYKAEVHTNTSYSFGNNVLNRIGNSGTHRFTLENGSIPGASDGEMTWQIYRATGTMRIGLTPVAATPVSNGSHVNNCFVLGSGYAIFLVVNGSNVALSRNYAKGDLLTIRVSAGTMYFLMNNVVVHSAAMAGTEELQEEVYIGSNPSPVSLVRLVRNTFSNIYKGKKARIDVTHASCDGSVAGSAEFNFTPLNWVGGSYVVTRLADSYVAYSGSSSSWTGLEAGDYSVVVSYPVSQTTTRYFSVGYEVDWEEWQGSNISVTGSGDNRLLTHTNTGTIDIARSKNIMVSGETGWISWEYKNPGLLGYMFGVGLYSQTAGIMNLGVKHSPDGTSIFSVPAENCSGSTSISPVQQMVFNKVRIERAADEVEFFEGNFNSHDCDDALVEMSSRRLAAFFFGTAGVIKNAAASFPCRTIAPAMTELSKKLDAGYFMVADVPGDDHLNFRYYEEYNVETVQCNIYKMGAEGNTEVYTNTSEVVYGDNRLAINLTDNEFTVAEQYYMLEVINSKNEKWYLKFKY